MFNPQTVVVEPPRLDPEAKGYTLTVLLSIALRTLILWAAIAILIPGYGITYWMTYLIIIGFNALRGPGQYAVINAVNRVARSDQEKRLGKYATQGSDEAKLRARSALLGF